MKYILPFILSIISLQAMSLDESIEYALEHNKALKQSAISIDYSKAVRDSKKARKYGRVDLLASYDHYNNSRTLEPLTPMSIVGSPDGAYTIPTTQDLVNVSLTYNVTLFDGFSQQNEYKISDLQYINSAIKNRLGREELIYNVRNLYISLLSLEEQLIAQKLYSISQERLLKRIEKEYELGNKSKLDILKAKNSFQASKTQLINIESNIEIIKATLSAVMGGREFKQSEAIEIDLNTNSVTSIQNSTITSLKRYRSTELNIEASKHKKAQAKALYYPKVDFSAYYGQNFGPNDTTNTVPLSSTAPTAGETLISEGEWNSAANWQVGVHLKWNILDFGVVSSFNEEARLSYMQAKLESEDTQITLRKDVSIAQSNIKLAQAQYYNTVTQYQILEESEKIEQVRYKNDAITLTDLLDTSAQKALTYAQMINAKYSYQKALYSLDYLLEKGDKE